MKFFKKIVKKDKDIEPANSKDKAKERLHLVLMQDRANVSADFLELMKQEIIEVIKKYIDVDEEAIDVRLTNKENDDGTNGAPALYANIPILNIKNETRKMDVKEQQVEEAKLLKENSKKNVASGQQNQKVEKKNAIDKPAGEKNSMSAKEEKLEANVEKNLNEATEIIIDNAKSKKSLDESKKVIKKLDDDEKQYENVDEKNIKSEKIAEGNKKSKVTDSAETDKISKMTGNAEIDKNSKMVDSAETDKNSKMVGSAETDKNSKMANSDASNKKSKTTDNAEGDNKSKISDDIEKKSQIINDKNKNLESNVNMKKSKNKHSVTQEKLKSKTI